MDRKALTALVAGLQAGELSVEQAVNSLIMEPFLEAGTAKIDLNRQARRGLPEVVLCEGKTPEQVREIFAAVADRGEALLGTRAAHAHFAAVGEVLPDVRFDPLSGLLRWIPPDASHVERSHLRNEQQSAPIVVVSAGSADDRVHREALGCLEAFGHETVSITDAGVAGLQRILAHVEVLNEALVVIVVAGMDGALPSVVAGLVASPVIAVPTSVGYGASFGGVSALLAMLNSCAGGVTVVNIDNGFGAAYAASLIARKVGGHD